MELMFSGAEKAAWIYYAARCRNIRDHYRTGLKVICRRERNIGDRRRYSAKTNLIGVEFVLNVMSKLLIGLDILGRKIDTRDAIDRSPASLETPRNGPAVHVDVERRARIESAYQRGRRLQRDRATAVKVRTGAFARKPCDHKQLADVSGHIGEKF